MDLLIVGMGLLFIIIEFFLSTKNFIELTTKNKKKFIWIVKIINNQKFKKTTHIKISEFFMDRNHLKEKLNQKFFMTTKNYLRFTNQ